MKKQMVGSGKRSTKDRADRATVEQVLDPRTRMVLFKMLNRGVFEEINGCVSTGKEANVYHAFAAGVADEDEGEGEEGGVSKRAVAKRELAIKVYKTAILVFKDRDRYVTGDSRFSRYQKSNPRQMVKVCFVCGGSRDGALGRSLTHSSSAYATSRCGRRRRCATYCDCMRRISPAQSRCSCGCISS